MQFGPDIALGEQQSFGAFARDRGGRAEKIIAPCIHGRNKAREGCTFDHNLAAHALGDFAEQVNLKALHAALQRREGMGGKSAINPAAERRLALGQSGPGKGGGKQCGSQKTAHWDLLLIGREAGQSQNWVLLSMAACHETAFLWSRCCPARQV